mmetsp:Transcript_19331/g.48636  ORF Transcript_19331/g.48636 Transcript_19331/m.48636 type:complete len:265 (-) Transcript_19331:452-1246(-)
MHHHGSHDERQVEEAGAEEGSRCCLARCLVKGGSSGRHAAADNRIFKGKGIGGDAKANGEDAKRHEVHAVAQRTRGGALPGGVHQAQHAVAARAVVRLAHPCERHEVRHLPPVQHRAQGGRAQGQPTRSRGPAHQGRHRAHERAHPGVHDADSLQRRVDARVQKDVGCAELCRQRVGLRRQQRRAPQASDQRKCQRVAPRDAPAGQRPVARALHQTIQLDFIYLVERVGGCGRPQRPQAHPAQSCPVNLLRAAQYVAARGRGNH